MRIALALALLLFAIAAPRPAIALSEEFSTPERLMQWAFTYRENPQPARVPEAVRAMYEHGLLRDEEKTGFLVGFIAGVIGDNPKTAPKLIERMLPLPAKEQSVVVRAIAYSGHPTWPALMVRFAPKMEERRLLVDEYLAGIQPELMSAPLDPVVVYTLWGYHVATGDEAPVRRVITALPWSDHEAAGMFSWDRFSASLGFGADETLRAELERLIVGSTAKWTLASYAEHDRSLIDLYRAEIPVQPEEVATPLSEVLAAAERFEAERLRKEEMAEVDALRAKLAMTSAADDSRAATAGSVGIATACIVAGAVGHPEIAIPCVVTGALYSGAVKLMEQ